MYTTIDCPAKSRSKTKNKRENTKKKRTIITVFGGPFSLGGWLSYRCLISVSFLPVFVTFLNEFIYIGQFHYQFYCFLYIIASVSGGQNNRDRFECASELNLSAWKKVCEKTIFIEKEKGNQIDRCRFVHTTVSLNSCLIV